MSVQCCKDHHKKPNPHCDPVKKIHTCLTRRYLNIAPLKRICCVTVGWPDPHQTHQINRENRNWHSEADLLKETGWLAAWQHRYDNKACCTLNLTDMKQQWTIHITLDTRDNRKDFNMKHETFQSGKSLPWYLKTIMNTVAITSDFIDHLACQPKFPPLGILFLAAVLSSRKFRIG